MLNVDKFFFWALNRDEDVQDMTDGRIFNPARTTEEEEDDNIPYIIVTYDGGSSTGATMDDMMSPLDQCNISVLCVAGTREELSYLTQYVHDAIKNGLDEVDFEEKNWGFGICNVTPSAGSVNYDQMKPCCYQSITYMCDTEEL